MRNPFFYGAGGVLSADIAVPEHERELAFYASVLTTGDEPLWRDDLMNNKGTPIIGLGARTPEYETLPLQWMPHFQVADVAASVANAIAMNGKELMHSKTDDGQSQWAVLTDPFGAAFGVIPVADSGPGGEPKEPFGCIAWLSLRVPNASASRDFYQHVVGWKGKSIENEHRQNCAATFEMQINDETSAAEIMQLGDEQDRIPAVWLIHLPVGDLAESLQRVKKSSGEVIEEFADTKYAVVRDPVGVYLALQADS